MAPEILDIDGSYVKINDSLPQKNKINLFLFLIRPFIFTLTDKKPSSSFYVSVQQSLAYHRLIVVSIKSKTSIRIKIGFQTSIK